ncbi:hypothetical protein HZA98_01335 [Candidatus Woesearchaeota archaeon]|nr:hypothetical protein [Candidatus Woesearchaeota archaeon]
MARKKRKRVSRKPTQSLGIIVLILNIFFPGLGTIAAGRVSEGLMQFILYIIGIFLSLFVIGIPIVIIVWIWALVTSIEVIRASQ